MGIVGGGAYAERLVTHERLLLRVPSIVSLGDAAAIPEVFITAFDALVAQGGLTVGSHRAGARRRVRRRHRGDPDRQGDRRDGHRHRVDRQGRSAASTSAPTWRSTTRTEDFVDAVTDVHRQAGVDVVLDVIGGDYVDAQHRVPGHPAAASSRSA